MAGQSAFAPRPRAAASGSGGAPALGRTLQPALTRRGDAKLLMPANSTAVGERGIGEQIVAELIVKRREVVVPVVEIRLGRRGIEEGKVTQKSAHRRCE